MEIIRKYFEKYGQGFRKRLGRALRGVLQAGKASGGEIAHEIAKNGGNNFKAADMFFYRFLGDKNFQIDDSFWRCNRHMIFDFLKEKHGLKKGDEIAINVDYTTNGEDFLILSAAITISDEKAISLYFTMRNYPKRKNQMDQKKMELAFFKGLRHILPKNFSYVIVGDRGFGNLRTIETCEKLGFGYVFRNRSNLIIELQDGEQRKLGDFKGQTTSFTAKVPAWNREMKFVINSQKDDTWYIATSLQNTGIAEIYANRFKIEKLFQDIKSSGFDIEKTKVRKYDRFKRLLYLVTLAHAITTFLGFFIKFCKKNYANHWDALTACSNSADSPSDFAK
jgi:hypothetical protein